MLTIAVPTYNREAVLLETLRHLMSQAPAPAEIIVVDQTAMHEPETSRQLAAWHAVGAITWIRRAEPSIAQAMNLALLQARHDIVLFLDDDIVPEPGLVAAHLAAHASGEARLIAGRIIQPWQEGQVYSGAEPFHFAQTKPAWIAEFMGGNFSLDRRLALELGGFDENFVRVAYRFEAELAYRWIRSGRWIYFEPAACIHHLKVKAGGTRAYGEHLTSHKPDHSVGAYYYMLRTWSGPGRLGSFLGRPFRAVINRHHLRAPWWIPTTLVAELSGMIWALMLAMRGPKYAVGERKSR